MIPDRDSHDNFQLDADGYAIPQADILADWFIEHGDDPDESDPANWPDEYDSIRVAIGPPIFPQERIQQPFRRFDTLPADEADEIPF